MAVSASLTPAAHAPTDLSQVDLIENFRKIHVRPVRPEGWCPGYQDFVFMSLAKIGSSLKLPRRGLRCPACEVLLAERSPSIAWRKSWHIIIPGTSVTGSSPTLATFRFAVIRRRRRRGPRSQKTRAAAA